MKKGPAIMGKNPLPIIKKNPVGTMNRHTIYNELGVYKYALHLADSDESFGISTLPRSLIDLYNIRAADSSLLSTRNKTSSSDLALMIILHDSTAYTAGSQFIFMGQRQGAAYGVQFFFGAISGFLVHRHIFFSASPQKY
ncbi:hypothetical protein BDC45DRAFT_542379 [Circinella umbellata]|nr:hypothetical protein BDC45DRAFT_542379 [Circinella umbellata]